MATQEPQVQASGPREAATAEGPAAAEATGTDGPGPVAAPPAGDGIDLLGMDLETLRNTDHPVLSELVAELRERVAGTRGESLWGHDSSV
ncbi:FxSxx-COOH cyclophane-containing RiPP peptide [Streptomyces sp. NBC_01190]|uniref:FxSxx-COOH cyclophane-containing RiPP peptide n=1 Tax=Streptomyces sp. NBC_01190 TaxID=2903767 RepID=UPI00386FA592|nr:FxSxx-COOH protein [Streptomyces sp. NBC_01190]